MKGKTSRYFCMLNCAALLIFLAVVTNFSQTDEDWNSPNPVLISQPDSNRALVNSPVSTTRRSSVKLARETFSYDSQIVIYVTNIELSDDEQKNALRVYAKDSKGRTYRFPVIEAERLERFAWVYALTIRLKDEIGFWKDTQPKGELLLNVAWRGMESNKVVLGVGRIGEKNIQYSNAIPTPFPTERPIQKNANAEYIGDRYSGNRTRFLEQSTFGPTVSTDARIRRMGISPWLNEQFELPYPSSNNPYPVVPLKSTDSANAVSGCGMFASGTEERRICSRDHYSMYPIQNWFFKEALYGDAQLRHRVSWAFSQLWVISGVDTQQSSWMIRYHQDISKNAFGNYRQLMKDITLNPAMGDYLDMVRSTKTSPNENFAREILQLFSIGLFMLNDDGTLKLDANGKPIPTYTQETVNNFTKVFTGWRLCETTATCPNRTTGAPNYKDPMLLNQSLHDLTAKTLLDYPNAVNKDIAANLNGATELEQALDNIFNHPNVGPFVSKFLIQQLVTSDPTPAYIGRVAAVFNNNGYGVRGDLKAVVRAILLDREARGDIKTDANYGKLREPVLFVTSVLRQFNARSADGTTQSDGVINNLTSALSQNVFYSPTVFNYYPPDYVIPGTSLLGPEFGIMTTGTAIGRANVINTLVFGKINTGSNNPAGTSIDLSEMIALAQADPTGNALVDKLNKKLLHGTMSEQMKNTILTAVLAVANTNPTLQAQTAVYLVATSSQYQVQR